MIPIEIGAKDNKIQYSRENISNYFLGIVSSNKDYNNKAFKHLKEVKSLKNIHYKFNIEFIRTLVLLEKFDEAFKYSKEVWDENELLYEIDLLLGLNSYIKKDYINAEKYFQRLNQTSINNPFFEDFLGNVLIAWTQASDSNKKNESMETLSKIPNTYTHIADIQNTFLQCYFNTNTAKEISENIFIKERLNIHCIINKNGDYAELL